jgi:hypothetical protein
MCRRRRHTHTLAVAALTILSDNCGRTVNLTVSANGSPASIALVAPGGGRRYTTNMACGVTFLTTVPISLKFLFMGTESNYDWVGCIRYSGQTPSPSPRLPPPPPPTHPRPSQIL